MAPNAEVYRRRRRVTIGDTCLQGCVYYARIIAWQGALRERWLLEEVPGIGDLLAGGLTLITRELRCTYHRDLLLGDPVEERLWFSQLDRSRATMLLCTTHADTGKIHAEGEQVILCADPGHRLQRWPEPIVRAVRPLLAAGAAEPEACRRSSAGSLPA